MARVVVIGGGYAGLACLVELAKKAPQLKLHLVDARAEHCKTTNLHKTFSRPVEDFTVPYVRLAERFGFDFHQQRLTFDEAELQRWQQQKRLPLGAGRLDFDWLVLSTGATATLEPADEGVYGLQTLQAGQGPALLEEWLNLGATQRVELSFVGGGATGLQVLFELHEQLRKKRADTHLRLIDLGTRTVPQLPDGAHRYIARKLCREKIDYLLETEFRGQKNGQILLTERGSGRDYSLPSTATLLFPGVRRAPFALQSNAYGQVECDGQLLPEIFSAGDCADFAGNGLNLLTAQAAVRKGKLVAHNIRNLNAGRGLRRYRYQEKGYLLSLGPIDAIGWLGWRCNLVKGFAANILKEAMESQYDLFLDGVDTYLGFP